MTHGSKSHRQPGSIGASATPSRVFPGKKMPGHLGDERVKLRQLQVCARQCKCHVWRSRSCEEPCGLCC